MNGSEEIPWDAVRRYRSAMIKKKKRYYYMRLCVVISAVIGICFGSVGISASEMLRAIFFEGESVNAI